MPLGKLASLAVVSRNKTEMLQDGLGCRMSLELALLQWECNNLWAYTPSQAKLAHLCANATVAWMTLATLALVHLVESFFLQTWGVKTRQTKGSMSALGTAKVGAPYRGLPAIFFFWRKSKRKQSESFNEKPVEREGGWCFWVFPQWAGLWTVEDRAKEQRWQDASWDGRKQMAAQMQACCDLEGAGR